MQKKRKQVHFEVHPNTCCQRRSLYILPCLSDLCRAHLPPAPASRPHLPHGTHHSSMALHRPLLPANSNAAPLPQSPPDSVGPDSFPARPGGRDPATFRKATTRPTRTRTRIRTPHPSCPGTVAGRPTLHTGFRYPVQRAAQGPRRSPRQCRYQPPQSARMSARAARPAPAAPPSGCAAT